MNQFQDSIGKISELFRKYSAKDIAASLFISSLWLPNRSAFVQYPFLLAVFATIKPVEFTATDQIHTYEDFRKLCEAMHQLVPSFPTMEDMTPEPDWGEIEYYLKNKRYRIFYGIVIESIVDHLDQFDLVHNAYNDEYIREAKRSPEKELRICLHLQDYILKAIKPHTDADALAEISHGHTEVPSQEFWTEAKEFYEGFDLQEFMSDEMLAQYSLSLGEFDASKLTSDQFITAFQSGTLLPIYAIKEGDRYLPVSPRRYSSALLEQWRGLWEKHHAHLLIEHGDYSFRTGVLLGIYMKRRMRTGDLFDIVSAATADKKAHELVFHVVLRTKNKLIMVYVLPPLLPGEGPQQDFKALGKQLNEALVLFKARPHTLLLRAEGKGVEFRRADEDDDTEIEPELFVVVPQVSTGACFLPADLPGHMVGLSDFLMIADEVENPEELAAFTDFLNTQTQGVMSFANSFADQFDAFKYSDGVLIGGASQPDYIWLDPNGGAFHRYESLKKFWKRYPRGYFGNPRHLKIVDYHRETFQLVTRSSSLGFSYHFNIGKTEVAIWAPFHEMSYNQGEITDLLMRCLEDVLAQNRPLLERHKFFQEQDELRIAIFPDSYASSTSEEDSHGDLKVLLTKPNLLGSQISHIRFPVLQMVFDQEKFTKEMQEVTDASLEISLAQEVLTRIDEIHPDSAKEEMVKTLDEKRSRKPRFMRRPVAKPAAFPEHIDPESPTPYEYKLARKRVSEIANEQGVEEGTYEGVEGIIRLNKIREVLVKEINAEVEKYDLGIALPYLIARTDALEDKRMHTKIELGISAEQDVDFDRIDKYKELFEEALRLQNHCHYLIEKFIQLQPKGTKRMNENDFKRLSGLVNWLHVLYSSSDCIKYQTHATALIFNHENIVQVGFDVKEEKQEDYLRQLAGEDLSPTGKREDRVEGVTPIATLVDQLDLAFRGDFGFSFRNLVHVLHALSKWSFIAEKSENEQTSYAATEDEIVARCLTQLKEDISEGDIRAVLKFLTLSSAGITTIEDQMAPADDVPVWENIKRLSRYDIRPLIFHNGRYLWGAWSAKMAEDLWKRTVMNGDFPAAFNAPKTKVVLKSWSTEIQKGIERKALEVVRRYSSHSQSVDLRSMFPKSNYEDVGDYDVLTYLPKNNVFLNIECKDIPHTACMKDSSRLRRNIFDTSTKNSHFSKILRREKYLRENWQKISDDLKWPVDTEKPPKIVNVYVPRHRNWWMKSPPDGIQADFIRIDLLDEYIGKQSEA